MCTLGVALAATTFMAMGGMLDLITGEQKVFAPSARRGMFLADAEISPVLANQNPFASDYMIVYCDDPEQLAKGYADWSKVQV